MSILKRVAGSCCDTLAGVMTCPSPTAMVGPGQFHSLALAATLKSRDPCVAVPHKRLWGCSSVLLLSG